jgi:hypothetical protein
LFAALLPALELRGGKLGLGLAGGLLFHLGNDDLRGVLGIGLQLLALLGDESVHGFLDEEFAIWVGLDGVKQEGVLHKEAAEVVAVFVGGAMLGVLSVEVAGDGFEEIRFHLMVLPTLGRAFTFWIIRLRTSRSSCSRNSRLTRSKG